jgi:1-deoxy-D-xylulose-5-phosphate synthase
MNRAFDQVLLDVAMHRCPVTFVLDRAGITGDDGASHNGMWDLSIFQVVPELRIAAPRDGQQLRELLHEAVDVHDAPTMVRFAKGAVPNDVPAVERMGTVDVLMRAEGAEEAPSVFVLSVGALATVAKEAAKHLHEAGYTVTVVDPRWIKPLNPAVISLAAEHDLVLTVEDNGRQGGVGETLAAALAQRGFEGQVQVHAVDQRFLTHAKRDVVLAEHGLTADAITAEAMEHLDARKR